MSYFRKKIRIAPKDLSETKEEEEEEGWWKIITCFVQQTAANFVCESNGEGREGSEKRWTVPEESN